MCYHVKTPPLEKLKKRFWDKEIEIKTDYRGFNHVNGFQHPFLPVITSAHPEKIILMEWGLIPFWVKDSEKAEQMQNRTLNAVAETIFEKPSFRGSIMRQRCLILTEGFYEWRTFNKKKYPYFIRMEQGQPTWMGGIWSTWTDRGTGEVKDTFSIITVAANPLMEQIHNTKKRMPFVIEKAPDRKAWLDLNTSKREIEALMKPAPAQLMEAWTISRKLNHFQKEDTDVPDINNRMPYPELPDLLTTFKGNH